MDNTDRLNEAAEKLKPQMRRHIDKAVNQMFQDLVTMSTRVLAVRQGWEETLQVVGVKEKHGCKCGNYDTKAAAVGAAEVYAEEYRMLLNEAVPAIILLTAVKHEDKAEQPPMQMTEFLTISAMNKKLRFPFDKAENGAYQMSDVTYILNVKGKDDSAADMQARRILNKIRKEYPEECKGKIIKGPSFDGAKGELFHEDIFLLFARVYEERRLRAVLCPSHGTCPKDVGIAIVDYWNQSKKHIVNMLEGKTVHLPPDGEEFLITDILSKLGFPGKDVDYYKLAGITPPEPETGTPPVIGMTW